MSLLVTDDEGGRDSSVAARFRSKGQSGVYRLRIDEVFFILASHTPDIRSR